MHTHEGYLAGDLELPQKALITAWDCLARFQEEMVLIGGLAVRYITHAPEPGMPGPVTLDVDFGISIGASGGMYDSIRTTLAKHGFAWKNGRFLRAFGDFDLHIDILTDDGTGRTGTVMVDEGLQVSLTPGVNRALACNRPVRMDGVNLVGSRQQPEVRICEIGPLLVLKLAAFGNRKAAKDAHDILYLGMNYSEGTEAALRLFKAEKHQGNPGMQLALTALKAHFLDAEANGPMSCAAFRLNDRHLSPPFRDASRLIREQCVTLAHELLGD